MRTMSRTGFPAAECDRARAWISESLDEELPELRRAALRAHLDECAGCSAFAADLGAVTSRLRAAPLVQPSRRVLMPETAPTTRGVALRRPRRIAVAAATAVAASAVLGAVLGQTTRQQSRPFLAASGSTGVAATQAPYLEQHLLAMLARVHYRRGRAIAT